MHIKTKKQAVLDVLFKIQGIAEKKTTANIFNHFLLDVSNNNVTVFATDTEQAIRIPLKEVEIFSEGKTCIPAKTFREIVKELDEDVELKLIEQKLYLQSGKTKYRLSVLDADDFPEWVEIKEMKAIDLSKNLLLKAIENTAYATGEYDTRYVLNGLMFEVKKESLHFVGTDGHRLAYVKISFKSNLNELKMILPKKFVNELKKLLDDFEGETVAFKFSSDFNFVQFILNGIKFQTRLIQGNYPDYEAVIPRSNDKVAVIDKKDFLTSLKRVAVISKERNKVVVANWQNGLLTISAQDPELGEAKDVVEIDYQGNQLTIGFNADYMIEAVEGIISEKVKITMSEPDKAIYITDTESNNLLYECVVMPVRL